MNITTVSRDAAIIDGCYVHYTRMTLAEENAWRAELARIESQKAPRRQSSRKAPRTSGKPNSRTNYAAAVIGRAMFETVVRVNSPAEIPFDGEAVDSPVYIHASDMYGVA